MERTEEVKAFEKKFDKEVKEIMIVTGANGMGGGRVPSDAYWTASIAFTAWKEVSGVTKETQEIRKEEGRLVTKADDKKLEKLQGQIKPDSIIKVKVRRNGTQFLLLEILDIKDLDKELEEFLIEQKKTIIYEDSILGSFTLDKSVNCFEKEIEWVGRKIVMTFECNEEGAMKESLITAYALIEEQTMWNEKMRRFAAEELLELKNDNWLDEGEEALTQEEFAARIDLGSIGVSPHGVFECWYNDDDIFFGHGILVEGTIRDGLTSASMM